MTRRRVLIVVMCLLWTLAPHRGRAADDSTTVRLYQSAMTTVTSVRTDAARQAAFGQLAQLLGQRLDAVRVWAHKAAVADQDHAAALFGDAVDAALSAVIAARSAAERPDAVTATLGGTATTLVDDAQRVTYDTVRTVWQERRRATHEQFGILIDAVDRGPAGAERTRLHEGLAAARSRLDAAYAVVDTLPDTSPVADDPRLTAVGKGLAEAQAAWRDVTPLLAASRDFLGLPR